MNALVIYQSKNGVTRRMAEEIAAELKNSNVEVKVGSINEISTNEIEKADRLYLGCRTSGMLVINQKPDRAWRKYVSQIPLGLQKNTTMFTTYKVATGSMFKEMRNELKYRGLKVEPNAFKSRNGNLTHLQREKILEGLK